MYINPTVYTGRPDDDRIPQELAIYDRLEELNIPYLRVDHDHADTMEACLQIESLLGAKICKNLFLCNRQQTQFYLLMMPGDKPFKTKFLSAQLGCARLSFADEGHMAQYLSTIPGSVSALELLFGSEEEAAKFVDVESFNRVVGVASLPSYYEDQLTAYTDVNDILNEYAMYALNGTMTAEEAMMEADALAEEQIAAAK